MTGLIILAAGPSSRLGQPKQKIIFEGKTLLQRAVETGIQSACKPVIVILGASADEIQPDIINENVLVCYNPRWQEGMSTSIGLGIEILEKTSPDVSDVILMVTDQPFVNTLLLATLIETKTATGKDIIACSYNNTLAVPVLFDKKFFGELLLLSGQEGAKKLLMKHKESVASVAFEAGNFDIDTKEDYEALIARGKTQ